MGRLGACVLLAGLLLIGGCSGDSDDQSAQGTWSVTVADNLGPQDGPNPVSAMQAVVAKYGDQDSSDHPVSVHGCHASQGDLIWQCEVEMQQCNSTVGVFFEGPDDATGEVGPSTAYCGSGHTGGAIKRKPCTAKQRKRLEQEAGRSGKHDGCLTASVVNTLPPTEQP